MLNKYLDELKYYLDTLSSQFKDASQYIGIKDYLRLVGSLSKCHKIHEEIKKWYEGKINNEK